MFPFGTDAMAQKTTSALPGLTAQFAPSNYVNGAPPASGVGMPNSNAFAIPPGTPASAANANASSPGNTNPFMTVPGTGPYNTAGINTSMSPLGGWSWNSPTALATAVNQNYSASYPGGGYKPVTSDQMAKYIPGVSQPATNPDGTIQGVMTANGVAGQPQPQPGQPFQPSAGMGGGANYATPQAQSTQGTAGQMFQALLNAGLSPDQALAHIATTGGMPLDATRAWLNTIAAQNQGIMRGGADIASLYGSYGQIPQGSSDFANAIGQYFNQANLQQGALLSQMQLPLMQQASSQAYGATGQLAGQAFQGQMQASAQSAQMAQLLAQMYGQGSLTAAGQLSGQGMTGAQQQLAAALGLNNLNVYGGLQSTQVGAGLGQQQYQDLQSQINNAYSEFLRTQPEYAPLLSQMASLSMGYPPIMNQAFQPSALNQILQSGGSLAQIFQLLNALAP